MQAYVVTRYGPPEVLELETMDKPVPGNREVLIRVYATTVTAGDWRIRSLDVPTGFKTLSRLMFGLRRPRQPVLGTELAGEIESVGSDVTGFKAGDRVFAYSDSGMGGHAEYAVMAENAPIAKKPDNLDFGEAAALSFGGTTALHFLRNGDIRRGDKVLIIGASGGVGTAAVQLAKHFGAEVTGVSSGRNTELVRSLGADYVIDYTTEDFTKNGETYDIIMDTAGTASYSRCRDSLRKGGRLIKVQGELTDMLLAPLISMVSDKKVIAGVAGGSAADLRFLANLAEKGEYRPVIEHRYSFDEMREAHRHVESRRKRGNVVVNVQESIT